MKLARPMISKHRKVLYYLGVGLAAFGMLLVILAVVGAAGRAGAAPRMVPLVVRAMGGVGLTAVGFASMAAGSHGLPGSAIDMGSSFESDRRHPRLAAESQETEDLLASHAGGTPARPMTATPQAGPGEAVCHWCHAVNDDQARYCDQCGMRF